MASTKAKNTVFQNMSLSNFSIRSVIITIHLSNFVSAHIRKDARSATCFVQIETADATLSWPEQMLHQPYTIVLNF
jgi:hypothetical protein